MPEIGINQPFRIEGKDVVFSRGRSSFLPFKNQDQYSSRTDIPTLTTSQFQDLLKSTVDAGSNRYVSIRNATGIGPDRVINSPQEAAAKGITGVSATDFLGREPEGSLPTRSQELKSDPTIMLGQNQPQRNATSSGQISQQSEQSVLRARSAASAAEDLLRSRGITPVTQQGEAGGQAVNTSTRQISPESEQKVLRARQAASAAEDLLRSRGITPVTQTPEFQNQPQQQAAAEAAAQPPVETYNGLANKFDLPPADLGQNSFMNDPIGSIQQITSQILETMGYGEANSIIEDITKEIEGLENKRDEKIRNINDDPWLTEGVRLRQIRKEEAKWEDQINNRLNRLNLLESTREDARAQSQFALGTAISLWDTQQKFQSDQLQLYYNQAQQQFENQVALEKLNIEAGKAVKGTSDMEEYIFAVENGQFSGSFIDFKGSVAAATRAPKSGSGGGGIPFNVGTMMSNPDLGTANDPFLAILQETAGGRALTQSETEPLNNANRVANQLDNLSSLLFETADGETTTLAEQTGPILGIVRSNNPYDTKAREVEASITALVPQLARGIYGEVGVLTDTDVARYVRTLPNMRNAEDVNDAVLGLTLRNVRSAFVSQLETMAAAGRDVSGFTGIYTRMNDKINEIETRLGINQQTSGPVQPQYQQEVTDLEFDSEPQNLLDRIYNFLF